MSNNFIIIYLEKKVPCGPKKSLFNDDTSFVMRRTLKPLHEVCTTYIKIIFRCL